ncbi:MAG: NACHT domain-containing protein, partial [bacterium]|nr:NACHT domain-containing protein [bacterium]
EPPRWRNKALASFLLRMGLAQSQGKGIPAIVKNTLELAGREPEIRPTGRWFQVVLPAYQPTDRSVSKTQVSISHLPVTANGCVGRDDELRRLDAVWDDPNIHVLSLVAWGGVGKTALVNRWLTTLAAARYRGADRVLGWSFYSQGTGDRMASADSFTDFALRYLGDPDPATGSAPDRGFRLAGWVRRQRTLLVLDGIESLQHPPGSTLAGRLKDPALATLIRELASENPGLCVITTRLAVADLAQFAATTAPQIDLEQLPPEAGAELLRQLGVSGSERELRAAAEEYGGHALTLALLGNYLRKVHAGDVGYRDKVELGRADARQGGHGYRVIAAYERVLESGPELAILRLLGLFDRPAAGTEIAALRAAPAIPDLTESLVGIAEDDWQWALSNLRENGLLAPVDPRDPAAFDSHPLVRAYFTDQLRQRHPEAWRAGNLRLREHQRISAPDLPGEAGDHRIDPDVEEPEEDPNTTHSI